MHTCPNCGKDTSSGMTEPCSHCGFSPGTPAEVGRIGAADSSVQPSPPDYPGDSSSQPSPPDYPGDGGRPPAEKKRRGWITIAVIIGFFVLGAIGDTDDDQSDATGPAASQVESALADDAAKLGVTVTIECADSVSQTVVDETFTCTARDPRGNVRTVELTNRDDRFEWSRRAFFQLGKLQSGPR